MSVVVVAPPWCLHWSLCLCPVVARSLMRRTRMQDGVIKGLHPMTARPGSSPHQCLGWEAGLWAGSPCGTTVLWGPRPTGRALVMHDLHPSLAIQGIPGDAPLSWSQLL